MSPEQWTAVDRYITEMLVPADPVLEGVLRDSAAAGLPQIHVAPNQGKLLMMLARICGAKHILEIGTLGGYSTIWLARGLAKGGRLVTLEADAKHADVARANFKHAGLADAIDLRVGRAVDTLPKLAGPFDLFFIDADKASVPDYFTWALRLLRPGSVIVVDNVVREGNVINANGDASVQGIRRFNEMLAKEPRVTATALQTVGSKGYDGFAVVLVTS